MERKGSAIWKGSIKEGGGTVSSESGVLNGVSYSFAKRFGEEKGTNPEELLAAGHASCFSMALSGQLGSAGLTADEIRTTATFSISKVDGGFAITAIHLDVTARVPGTDAATFSGLARNAKEGCPVSKAFSSVPITMDARLEG